MPTFMIASSRGGHVRTMPDPLVHDLIFSSVAGSQRWHGGALLAFQNSRLIVRVRVAGAAIPITIIACFDTATVCHVND